MEHFDLDGAVRAGVLRSDQADALRRFDEQQRNAPSATEERFAFVSGFADIMAAIGLILMAGTSMMLLAKWPAAGLGYPFLCWWAATYFTCKRKLMFTSFVIFVAFALSAAMSVLGVLLGLAGLSPFSTHYSEVPAFNVVVVAGAVTAACWFYWRRFQLPISFAAFAVALSNLAVNCLRFLIPGMPTWGVGIILGLTGPALFACAMWWDMSDVRRETNRSDVAFWLHIAAGFLLVKTGMALVLGTRQSDAGWGRMFTQVADPSGSGAIGVVVLFLMFAAVALVIDRRSLLTSGMFYVVPAVASLAGGLVYTNIGPALFVAGGLLTILAVKWTSLRELLLRRLPEALVAQLPRTQLNAVGPRPVY